jgi:hypothetical protein
LIIAAGAMLAWTWGRWGDPFVDFGREVYVAWRLAAGEVLYRDIDYFNGPLSPYLNALIFRVAGARLLVLEGANLLCWAIVAALSYRLYLWIADELAAFCAVLLFILLFSFIQLVGINNYNYTTPYAHEATHSMACAMGALVLLGFYLRRSRDNAWPVVGCGLLLGMTFLMKVEVTVALGAALAVGLGLGLVMRGANARQWAVALLMFLGAALVPALMALTALSMAMPFREALTGLLGSWKYLGDPALTDNPFYRRVMGTDHIGLRIEMMGITLAGELAVLAPPLIATLAARRFTRQMRVLLVWLGGLYVAVMLWTFWDWFDWRGSMRPLNLFAVSMCASLLACAWRERGCLTPRLILQLSFAVFATAMLGKMFFNVAIYHYGFVLAGPAFALMVLALVGWIPNLLSKDALSAWIFRAAAMVALGGFTARHLMAYEQYFRSRPTQTIGIVGDTMQVERDGPAINAVLEVLSRQPPNKSLAVIPQGAMLNYLSSRVNPTGELTLLPGEVHMFGEARILSRFGAHPPDWIVMQKVDMSEFGYRGFGIDYAQPLAAWITSHYSQQPVDSSGSLRLLRLDPGSVNPGSPPSERSTTQPAALPIGGMEAGGHPR